MVCRLWIKPQACNFHDVFSYFVADGSFTADGGLLQPTGGVKTTPGSVESLQGIRVQVRN